MFASSIILLNDSFGIGVFLLATIPNVLSYHLNISIPAACHEYSEVDLLILTRAKAVT